jgi:hypothetical protein
MKEGTKQFAKTGPEPIPESYLLCRECDGSWVDARNGSCAHCREHTTSKDFHLCLSCALRERKCQNCSQEIEVNIPTC